MNLKNDSTYCILCVDVSVYRGFLTVKLDRSDGERKIAVFIFFHLRKFYADFPRNRMSIL